jgi:hypothetical protein
MPLEWRISTLYMSAIFLGAVLIVVAVYDSRSELHHELAVLRDSIKDHQAAECESLGYTVKPKRN